MRVEVAPKGHSGRKKFGRVFVAELRSSVECPITGLWLHRWKQLLF